MDKRISARMCEHIGVIEVSMNSSQEDVERVKIIHQEQMSDWTGEQVRAVERPKISGQENVVATNVPEERSSERKGERTGVIALPKVSYQESVAVVKMIPQERISERSQVIEVP